MKTNRAFRAICLTTCLCCFVACYNEPNFQPEELIAESHETQQSPYHITITQALDNMLATMEVLSPSSRAEKKTIRNIQTVTSADILQQTRSTNGEEPTDAYYIVNFENDEGFAILAADARFGCDVIALAESGNLNYRKKNLNSRSIDPSQEDTTEHGDAGENITLEDLYIPEDDDYLLGGIDPDGLITSLTDDIYQEKRRDPFILDDGFFTGGGGSTPSYTYRTETRREGQIGPLLTTLWHQHKPFNLRCKYRYYYYADDGVDTVSFVKDYDYLTHTIENYIGKEPTAAGCIAIAVAQILAYNKFPDTHIVANIDNPNNMTGWDEFLTEESISYSSHNMMEIEDLARMIRSIGDGCNMRYGFSGIQSFATPNAAKKYLKELGYTNTDRHVGYSLSTVKEMLDNDSPTLMGALALFPSGGHAWLIDGYYKLITENICENQNGNVVSRTTISENDYVHCCWGWSNGKANGWYISDVFDISQTQNYDNPNIAVDEELKVHYRYWMRMVTYDKPNQN
ncbi:MAG: C10 family peptidase [Tidjanibacter sp.]|nr:C10 family peptidase [Tidjanibacter sp.]